MWLPGLILSKNENDADFFLSNEGRPDSSSETISISDDAEALEKDSPKRSIGGSETVKIGHDLDQGFCLHIEFNQKPKRISKKKNTIGPLKLSDRIIIQFPLRKSINHGCNGSTFSAQHVT
jgi:hypothetical protein